MFCAAEVPVNTFLTGLQPNLRNAGGIWLHQNLDCSELQFAWFLHVKKLLSSGVPLACITAALVAQSQS